MLDGPDFFSCLDAHAKYWSQSSLLLAKKAGVEIVFNAICHEKFLAYLFHAHTHAPNHNHTHIFLSVLFESI